MKVKLNWSNNCANIEQPPVCIQSWLMEPYILSQELKKRCGSLNISLLGQVKTIAPVDEYSLLCAFAKKTNKFDCSKNDAKNIWLREVVLNKVVYARISVLYNHFSENKSWFLSVGNKSFGESLLYNNSNIARSNFEYSCVKPYSYLHNAVVDVYGYILEQFWARRSVFTFDNCAILVTECFLPGIENY